MYIDLEDSLDGRKNKRCLSNQNGSHQVHRPSSSENRPSWESNIEFSLHVIWALFLTKFPDITF